MKSAVLARNASRGRGRSSARKPENLPAPIAGWSVAESLARTSPATAQILENFRPTTTGIALRGGSRTYATCSLVGNPVECLMSYNGSVLKKLFAATATAIFDISTIADPSAQAPSAVTGQTSGYYSYVNFTNSGSAFLIAVNGTDSLLLYEPSQGWKKITDTSTPAITGLATSKLEFVWAYKSRIFFIEKDSLRVRFLDVNNIAGALKTLDLSGEFQRGGSLLFGATWSVSAGSGLDDKCVFVTTEGEVAVYQGNNPASASAADWSKVGIYDIGRPLGPRATMRAGGDLVIATEEGLVPLSGAIEKDIAALNFGAISKPIAPEWKKEASARVTLPWEIVKWPSKSYAIVSAPVTSSAQRPISLVVNTITGAWCKYAGWDTRCLVLHDDRLYFGTNDGRVKLGEVGGNDDGAGIYYVCVSNPEHLGFRGVSKTIKQARPTYTGLMPFLDQVSASMDYNVALPSPPSAAPDGDGNEFDVGKWDEAKWDTVRTGSLVSARWVSIGLTGAVMQYQIQITGALRATPDNEFVSIDVSFELGETIV